MSFSEFAEITQFTLGKDSGDEQNGIGPIGGGFDDVQRVDGKVFAEDGNGDGGAGFKKMVPVASEVFLVGQDGEGSGASGFVLTG